MIDEQEEFFKELKNIQDFVVESLLIKEKEFYDTKSLLQEATYQTIYKFMELLDGYGQNLKKYEIRIHETEKILNASNSLHDKCEEYLIFTDV